MRGKGTLVMAYEKICWVFSLSEGKANFKEKDYLSTSRLSSISPLHKFHEFELNRLVISEQDESGQVKGGQDYKVTSRQDIYTFDS